MSVSDTLEDCSDWPNRPCELQRHDGKLHWGYSRQKTLHCNEWAAILDSGVWELLSHTHDINIKPIAAWKQRLYCRGFSSSWNEDSFIVSTSLTESSGKWSGLLQSFFKSPHDEWQKPTAPSSDDSRVCWTINGRGLSPQLSSLQKSVLEKLRRC